MSLQHESKVLAGILKGYESNDILTRWTPKHFNSVPARAVAEAVWEYWKERASVPSFDIALIESAKKGRTKDREKIQAFMGRMREEKIRRQDFGWHITEVEKSWQNRSVRQAIEEALECCELDKPEEARRLLVDKLSGQSGGVELARVLDYGATLDDRIEKLRKLRDNPDTSQAIGTGIAPLDIEMDGGLRPGELGMFFAIPAGGKSISLQDIAAHAASELKVNVAFVTIEMPPEQLSYRFDSRLSGLKYRKFRRAQVSKKEERKWRKRIKRLVPAGRLKIIGVPEGCTTRVIECELDKLAASGWRPRLIVVDYAGIMTPKTGFYKNASEYSYIGQISKDLKELAMKRWLPLWSAAQLTADSQGKEALGYSDVGLAKILISQNCDLMIGIVQPPAWRALGQAKLQFMKARDGYENEFIDIEPDWDHIRLSSVKKDPKKKSDAPKKTSSEKTWYSN